MLNRHPFTGRYVVFEGIDGSGKDTQISLLEPFLIERGIKYIRTAEPTTFLPTGLLIKAVLRGSYSFDPRTMALLFISDSFEHIRLRVIPNLKTGRWVVSSRSFFSTLAYQTVAGVNPSFMESIMDNLGFFLPDLVILLDVDAGTALARKGVEGTGHVYERIDFLSRVREEYLRLAERFDVIKVVDGRPDPFEVSRNVRELLTDLVDVV